MAIRVLIVDDSATARTVLKDVLSKDSEIEVIATAPDAYVARDKIVQLKPDVICLDVEMPRMDGISFLKKIMKYFPTPVLMVSSLTQDGAQVTFDALEAGAIDYVAKPHSNIYDGIDEIQKELIQKVKMVASSNLSARIEAAKAKTSTLEYKPKATYSLAQTTNKLIAIGASTGGTVALAELIARFTKDTPGVVVVQHMPSGFTNSFAQRLNSLCEVEVKEAEDGDIIGRGRVLVAPGDLHMVVRRDGGNYRVKLGTGEKISGHRPSVDVLFNSVASHVGSNAIGVLLTGMGSDGAKGMLKMKTSGASTIAQDEKSSIVWGMPKVAYEIGAVDFVEPLSNIDVKIASLLSERK
ncbi:response regulator receiver (CheY-like) modulated CheB methylesterase [Sulfurimonas denitrificans DSM 1251]|uniref:Protein-glutamate methylesterase/protein-glutamine glutaminase n=1 Tax=Sulfurimonas denitrificans (strain ATCC 33889 / DSM 1251) TaxID=326298 RepID=CHEB_SULDN|nr:chemotaxis response regulator protein-glutamate methylesterase [Sulfurimonas denitrificans]Q30RX5.1 RecName: Full=Protein-glutamate methylesterase/protein-glutamine glutaminase [Sulfurimonas denitrificans DSM 1251]ABB44256.1 response regulator receiver (CheY-like) modulated CheB methylesterase [Sulfurimonas denitrificans DSM 1251]MDD3443090.1 chemotaxis response regulator protein-glutamate methylesterase [Sulfurimonas denitrificans]